MFDALSSRLQNVFRNLRGMGHISESNVSDSLRDVRMALLDADVNFQVARDFIERVKTKALGLQVIQSVQPGQQMIKIIYDELVALFGSQGPELLFSGNPAVILMCGLHGSGKTTSSAKLARWLKKRGKSPLLVAADVYRPAAMDQLAVLAEKVEVPVCRLPGETDALKIVRAGLDQAKAGAHDVMIIDTAGRLQIDEPLVQELVRVRDLARPCEILLVLDAATGQEAVNVATHFDKALGVTGAVLTKLDGDARGGSALSFRAVVGKPIKFMGTGEKPEDFDVFHPERMSQRILGMGDVVSLVEKAAEAVDQQKAMDLEEKMRKGVFTLEDFLVQLQEMRKLGPLENIIGLLPGGADMVKGVDMNKSEKDFRRMGGIICAMTPKERRTPQILNAKRRQRIAKGSGVSVAEVNNLLRRFDEMQAMMRKLGKFQKMMGKFGGKMPPMPFGR
jgi:signal recognition particle subunit SRP54